MQRTFECYLVTLRNVTKKKKAWLNSAQLSASITDDLQGKQLIPCHTLVSMFSERQQQKKYNYFVTVFSKFTFRC